MFVFSWPIPFLAWPHVKTLFFHRRAPLSWSSPFYCHCRASPLLWQIKMIKEHDLENSFYNDFGNYFL